MGVFLGRGAGFVHLVITLVLRQWKTARAASRVRDEIALGWAVAQPTYRRSVCRVTYPGSIPYHSGDCVGTEEIPTPVVKI